MELAHHSENGLGIKKDKMRAANLNMIHDNEKCRNKEELNKILKAIKQELELETSTTATIETNFSSPTATSPLSADARPDSQNPQNQAQGKASEQTQAQRETQDEPKTPECSQEGTTERSKTPPQGGNGNGKGACRQ